MAVPFLVTQLGSLARLKVEVAWGANLAFDASNWTWTDITSDVREAPGITISPMGRSDGFSQSQPAGCVFQVNNPAGAYTPYSPMSANYPNVRHNTPVRVQVSLNNGGQWFTRFFGYANGFTPGWDAQGKAAYVTVSASATLRRVGQGTTPLRSPLMRAYSQSTVQPLAYIPFEDGPNSTQVASGLPNGAAGTINPNTSSGFAPFQFAQVSTCPGSAPLPEMSMPSGTAAQATFPIVAGPDSFWSVDFTAFVSAQTIPAAAACQVGDLLLSPGGTWTDAAFLFNNNTGSLQFIGTRPNLTQDMLAEYDPGSLFDGKWHHYRLTATQSGGNVVFTIECDGVQVVTNTIAGTLKASTTGILYAQNQVSYSYGHVAVFGQTTSTFYSASTGYTGETATARLTRLVGEEGGLGMPLVTVGTSTTTMGAQGVDTFLNLIRECEAADGGLLFDGLSQGLTYVCRSAFYNQPASVTLDANSGQVPASPELAPIDDDQRLRNLWVVGRKNGSSATYEDIAGPLGTSSVGMYNSQTTLNLGTDSVLANVAAWLVHLGTVEGLRYANLYLDLAGAPELASNWLGTIPSERVDVTNLSNRLTQHPAGSVPLIVEGYTEFLNKVQWRVTANCSPFQAWNVDALGTTFRLELAGQTLASNLTSGATTLSLATASGYNLFTTTARFPADFPMDLNVSGWIIHVTAASGTSSPQTLTIDPAPNTSTISSGAKVSLWRPACLAL